MRRVLANTVVAHNVYNTTLGSLTRCLFVVVRNKVGNAVIFLVLVGRILIDCIVDVYSDSAFCRERKGSGLVREGQMETSRTSFNVASYQQNQPIDLLSKCMFHNQRSP